LRSYQLQTLYNRSITFYLSVYPSVAMDRVAVTGGAV